MLDPAIAYFPLKSVGLDCCGKSFDSLDLGFWSHRLTPSPISSLSPPLSEVFLHPLVDVDPNTHEALTPPPDLQSKHISIYRL